MTISHDVAPETEPDAAAVEAFANKMIDVLNDATTAVLTSIGHQTGLFETLAELPPATSQQIADASGLHERYVREWLGGMTTARITFYDSSSTTYWLPREHAASLTQAAGPDNLARLTQFVPLMGGVEQQVIDCFRNGGGLPYSAYPRFHQVMFEDSAATFEAALVDVIVPLVPGLPERLRAGIDVADIGCGRGHAVNLLAQAFPASGFTGFDFSDEALATARSEAELLGLTNATFVGRDVADLGETGAFDLVTAFDAIHDQAHPSTVLANIAAALRPDGTFLMMDIRASSNVEDNLEIPWATFLYTVSTMHCMSVSLGLDGDGLGTVWGRQLAVSLLERAGFGRVDVNEVESDPFSYYYVARKN